LTPQKKLIIIPGSCSHISNWFDQIEYARTKGFTIVFLRLDADKFRDFSDCADNLFHKISLHLNAEQETVILAHSMGSMLLLKILSGFQHYTAKDHYAYEKIISSRLIFLQMPINLHKKIYLALNIFKFFVYPIQLFYSFLLKEIFAWFLLLPKKIILFLRKFKKIDPAKKFLDVLDSVINQGLILNGVLGTKPWEFFNLVRYYWQFGIFTAQGFDIEFDRNKAKNYFFTYGDPDYFCEEESTHKLAEFMGANLVHMPLSMHNPQHMFWCRDKVNELITSP
jgi:hypothetical protein